MFNKSIGFLDSLIDKEVTIALTSGPITIVEAELVWHDEEAIGIKFRKEEEDSLGSTAAEKVIKEKETLIYKSAIQSISEGWKNIK